jgi:hypothetical protein
VISEPGDSESEDEEKDLLADRIEISTSQQVNSAPELLDRIDFPKPFSKLPEIWEVQTDELSHSLHRLSLEPTSVQPHIEPQAFDSVSL